MLTNEQIEVLRHLATTFGHIGDEDESVAAIKAAISLAERVRDAERTDCAECYPALNATCPHCGGAGYFLLLKAGENNAY